MYLLYSILLTLGVVALLPRFIFDAFRHGKYVAGLGQRMGNVPPIDRASGPVVWLHCVSVGETQAARPLVRELRQSYPSSNIVISTTTLTGQRLAREVFRDDAAQVIYFPFDWRWTVRRALRAIRPSTVLIMETELWPTFLRECRRRNIRTAIVNGRLSERSFRRYRLIRRFIRRVVNDLDLALMQTEADAARIRELGLDESRVTVSGNIKFDASSDASGDELTEELRTRFALDDRRPLIVAASTHAPEERIVIDAFRQLSADGRPAPRLLIAPRHPERFAETAELLESSGLSWTRRSAKAAKSDEMADAILLDSIGELRSVYPLAEVVFVGGSIATTGGHNVLEPAAAGTCIVTGAHTHNFAAIMEAFVAADALVQLPPVADNEAAQLLATVLSDLLEDDQKRTMLSKRAKTLFEQNRGATKRTVEMLAEILDAPDKLPADRRESLPASQHENVRQTSVCRTDSTS
jgi:3-deoxy-D-manno-octulosonic-acid transferase